MRPRINHAVLDRLKVEDPVAYEENVKLLADLDWLWENDRLQFYEPHPKQHQFHNSRTRVKAFLGGNQSGKSTAGVVDDLIQALDREALTDKLKPFKRFDPPFFCRVVTPDFTNTMEGVIFEKIREWCPKQQLLGGSWDSAFDKQLRKLRFANGSWFDFLTFEQDLDKFGGVTLDRVHFDEEPPGEKGKRIYHQALVRIMKRAGDIVFSMTPEFGMSWVFDEVYERRDEPDVTVVQVATDDNVHLPQAEIEASYGRMSKEEQDAKRRGLFVHFGGLVLDIDEAKHVVESVEREHVRHLSNYVVIDPGAARAAVLFGGIDKDDVILCYDELYVSGGDARVDSLAVQIREKLETWGLREDDISVLVDPSARNRTVDGGEGVEAEFWRHRLYPALARNNRFASIMQLRRRAAAQEPTGLLVSRNCPNLLWELRRWRVAEDERTAEDKPQRGTSRDTFATIGPDHLADCLRYMAMEWTWGPPVDHPAVARNHWGTAAVASGRAPRFRQPQAHDVPPTGALT